MTTIKVLFLLGSREKHTKHTRETGLKTRSRKWKITTLVSGSRYNRVPAVAGSDSGLLASYHTVHDLLCLGTVLLCQRAVVYILCCDISWTTCPLTPLFPPCLSQRQTSGLNGCKTEKWYSETLSCGWLWRSRDDVGRVVFIAACGVRADGLSGIYHSKGMVLFDSRWHRLLNIWPSCEKLNPK